MPIVVSAKDNVIINAGDGTIANLSNTATGTGAITIMSGTVTKLATASNSTIAVNGGEVKTIEKTNTAGNVTIGAATVGTLEAKTAAGSTFTTTVTKGAEITESEAG